MNAPASRSAVAVLSGVLVVVALVVGGVVGNPGPRDTASATSIGASASLASADGATLHYTANEGGSYAASTALGYDLHDTGMSASTVNSLPPGTRALVWAENGKCPTSLSSTFTSFVSAQASNPNVYGYFLVDEPSDTSAACVAGIKEMADFIHAHAPGKKAFVELTDYPGTYEAYAPSKSGADLIGIDPYPCRHSAAACNYPDVHKQVNDAIAAGVPRAALVPTFQLFGDSVWSPPSQAELQAILSAWHEELPSPAFDYSYSWGCQGGSLTACLATRTDWQSTMKAWFAGAPVASPSPPPVRVCRAAAPTIGRASPGARRGRATAVARWSAPKNACALPLTGFVVTAIRLNERGRVVLTRYFTTGPAARSREMSLRRYRRWTFRVTAVNALGRGTISARSNIVRAR